MPVGRRGAEIAEERHAERPQRTVHFSFAVFAPLCETVLGRGFRRIDWMSLIFGVDVVV